MRVRVGRSLAAASLLTAMCLPATASAQSPERPRPIAMDAAVRTLKDPTTFIPAIVAYEAKSEDWRTCQVLFAHGWVEQNPRYTTSGRPNDTPVSFAAGKKMILHESLITLQWSAVHNMGANIAERAFLSRYPRHRRLIRTFGWVERIGFAGYLTYMQAAKHFRQVERNRELARIYGY